MECEIDCLENQIESAKSSRVNTSVCSPSS